MTAIDRFDPFEGRIVAAIDEIAAPARPSYLDDVLRQTARTPQRPRWSFPGRWLPLMDTTLPRAGGTRLPVRPILLVLLALLLAAAAIIAVVGAQQRTVAPYGLARNGLIAYAQDDDLYIRDDLQSPGRLLVATPGKEVWPYFSPDGSQLIVTIEEADGLAYDYVVNADGTNLRRLLPDPIFGDGQVIWSPDSRTAAIVNEVDGLPRLYLVDTATDTARPLDIGTLRPGDLAWNLRDPGSLVFQGTDQGSHTDLYLVNTDGTGLRALDLPDQQSGFGIGYTNSGPAYSPDGSLIAYNHIKIDPETRDTHFRVDLVTPDGTSTRALPAPENPKEQQAWPLFSPDGRWILLHHWTWKDDDGEGWLTVVPTDGSAPPRAIGPRFPGGEDTGLLKAWSPDGTRVLVWAQNLGEVWSIDPATGDGEQLPWTDHMPDWQRRAP